MAKRRLPPCHRTSYPRPTLPGDVPPLTPAQATLLLDLPPFGAIHPRMLHGDAKRPAGILAAHGLVHAIEAQGPLEHTRFTRSSEGDALVHAHRPAIAAMARRSA